MTNLSVIELNSWWTLRLWWFAQQCPTLVLVFKYLVSSWSHYLRRWCCLAGGNTLRIYNLIPLPVHSLHFVFVVEDVTFLSVLLAPATCFPASLHGGLPSRTVIPNKPFFYKLLSIVTFNHRHRKATDWKLNSYFVLIIYTNAPASAILVIPWHVLQTNKTNETSTGKLISSSSSVTTDNNTHYQIASYISNSYHRLKSINCVWKQITP